MNFLQILKCHNIFDKSQKKEHLILFSLILITMLLEVFSVGLIVPVIMTILNQDVTTYFPFLLPIIDSFGEESNKKLIIFTSLALITSYFLKNIYLLFFLNVEGKYLAKIEKVIKFQLFQKYISYRHYNYFKSNSSKLMSNIIVDIPIVVTAIRSLLLFFAELTVVIGLFGLLFFVEPLMMLFNLIIVIIGLFFFNTYSKNKLVDISSIRKKSTDELFLTLNNGFDSVKEINLFNKNNFFEKTFSKNNNEIYSVNKKFHVYQGLPKIFYEFLGVFMLMAIIIIMAINLKDVNLMITFLAIAGASAFRLIPSANRLLNCYQYLSYAEKSIQVINEELKEDTLQESKLNETINFKKSIIFKNVSFKYDTKNNYILEDINFELKKPNKILLFGETGVGKSTFIELLLGLLKPTKGSVEVESKNVYLHFKEWRKCIGYIPQKVTLLEGSVLSNIAFGEEKNEINYELLQEAIKLAELKNFIDKLPNGLESEVGKFGSKISGGQIQRIGIARAIYRNPEILILDEATNALDEMTEKKVISNILQKFKDKILICISHNKSLLGEIDNKFKIENRQLVSI